MRRHTGNPYASLWLIGDSEPEKQCDQLALPLDARHPTRHNIWTPVLLRSNLNLFRTLGRNIDEREAYVRNAIGNPKWKPSRSAMDWPQNTRRSLYWFRKTLQEYKPLMVITFGGFAFEFVRRACSDEDWKPYGQWTVGGLAEQFRCSQNQFDPAGLNVIPLLHATIARGRYLSAHREYTGRSDSNYFDYVGEVLAEQFAQLSADDKLWARAKVKML